MNRYKYISAKESGYSKRWNLKLSEQAFGQQIYFRDMATQLEMGKSVVVVKGRQVGLSTFSRWFALHQAYEMKKSVLIASPTSRAARLDIQQISRQVQTFGLDVAQTYRDFLVFDNRGQILATSSLGETKGVRVDVCITDECDVLTNDCYQGFQTTMAHGRPSMSFDFGTPMATGEGNVLVKLWENSDQREFHVRCGSCLSFFAMTTSNCDEVLLCPNCDKFTTKIQALNEGRWIASRPESKQIGYRVPAFLSPDVNHRTVVEYNQMWAEHRFKMEFEGKFLHE
jgi:hypothetical protein